MNINFEDVKKVHGENALNVYRQIARLVGGDDSGLHTGGMDLTNLDAGLKKKVEKLLEAPKEDKKEGNK